MKPPLLLWHSLMLALVQRLQQEMAESQADFVLNSKDHLQNVEFPLDLARLAQVHLSPVLHLDLAHLARVHLSPVLRLDLAHLARVHLSRVLRLARVHLARVHLSPVLLLARVHLARVHLARVHLSPVLRLARVHLARVLRLAQVRFSLALRLDYEGSPLVAAQSDHLVQGHFALNHC